MPKQVKSYHQIGDIVKEYPDMFKIVIYHNDYFIPAEKSPANSSLIKATKRQDNIDRSVRRTRSVIKDIMLSNNFDLWCTWTFNQKRVKNRYDINECRRVLQTWLRNQKTNNSPNLRYLIIPEYHEDGAVHFHGFLKGFNGRLKDSKKRTKHNQTIYNATGYYSGFTQFVKIGERFDSSSFKEDYKRVTNYMSKYITKDMPLIHGRKRYLCSKELIRPEVQMNQFAEKAALAMIRNFKPSFINNQLEVHYIAKSSTNKLQKNNNLNKDIPIDIDQHLQHVPF